MKALLYWAAAFFVVAFIAGLLGLVGISAIVVEITKILFLVCLALFVLSLIASMRMRGPRKQANRANEAGRGAVDSAAATETPSRRATPQEQERTETAPFHERVHELLGGEE